jgi:LuxR family maltose regulon positive regulatory protein
MLETTHILRTKLHQPPVRGDHVHRIRLIEKLNSDYQKNALILVSAPAGYGKSYLVSCWLTESNIPFGWISLNEEDNDLRKFLEYFAASIESVAPGKLERTTGLLKTSELPPLPEITSTLINELDEIEKEFVLVLDDYHTIREKGIHDLINGLLQYPPDNLLMCIITRQDPPLKIGSLRAYNRMNEIRMQDLSFTLQEIPVLYKNMKGFEIGEEISEKLLEQTEGWVTGLRLTALSVNSADQLKGILKKMSQDSRLVTDYLIEEVLTFQPEEFQKYLLKTSLLDRFCADLVERLNITKSRQKDDGISGEEFIKWLESTNLFVIPLDNEHKWFRYHHLFRELLLKQLKKKRSPEQINTILKEAGEWFGRNNFVEEAIKYMLAAGKPENAAEIVGKHSIEAMDTDHWRILEGWLKMLPEDILHQSVKFQISIAYISHQRFKLAEMHAALQRSKELFGDRPEETVFYGEWCSLMGFSKAIIEGDISGSINFLNKALNLIPEKPLGLIRAETELQMCISRHIARESDEVLKKFNARISAMRSERGRFWERMQFGLCFIHYIRGELQRAYENAVILKEDSKRTGNDFAEGWSRWVLGAASFNMFILDEAHHQFTRVLELRYATFDRASIDGLIGLALTYQILGQPKKADETLLIVQEYTEWTKDPTQVVLLSSAKARIALLRGNISEAINWQRTLNLEPHFPSMVMFLCNPFITECGVLLAEGTDSSLFLASKKLEKLYEGTKAFNYTCQTIEVIVLQSMLQKKLGHTSKAAKIMEKALEIAAPGGWIRPFIEAGNDVIIILNQLIKQNIYADYCKMLIKVFENYENGSLKTVPPLQVSDWSLSEPLTQRELEILALLSHGLKNREIGDKIFLAPTTIKKHVYNIYQKLNVHSRLEVVSKAQELGLISK